MAKTSGVCSVLSGLVALGTLGACGPSDWDTSTPTAYPTTASTNALFAGKTEHAKGKVAPVAGGTLLVTKDGHAIASDPDRDLVHVVDVATQKVVSVPLEAGDEPGRIVEGAAGTAYVVARRGGVVLAVDTALGTARRIPVCAAPRGIAFDATLSRLYVACRSGLLAVVDTATDTVTARHRLDGDLRDVLVSGDNIVLTRFKTAEVLVVSRDGEVLRRSQPVVTSVNGASITPAVAYRALSLPKGGVLVGHVDSSNTVLPSGAGAYYGAFCGGSVADVSITAMDPYGGADGATLATLAATPLGGAAGPLDVAVAPDGVRIALLATGNSWAPTANTSRPANLWITSTPQVKAGTVSPSCGGLGGSTAATVAAGEPVAVAFDGDGRWVVQSRQPAQLQFEQGGTISLAADSRFDTGFAMFHMNTGGGIACTSCHPEAGEDGHTWNFSIGPRRSQTLEGGISKRAPFHWSGDLTTFDELVDEVMLKRMSLTATVDKAQRDALRDWIDSVPKSATADDLDSAAVARGRVLFESEKLACATCHVGADYTDNLPHDVGTGAAGSAFITPSLVDVNVRAPLFHDGCALSLEGRFGPCGGGDKHGVTSQLTRADEADLVAFMQSL